MNNELFQYLNAGHHLPAESRGDKSSKGGLNLWWRARCMTVLAAHNTNLRIVRPMKKTMHD